MDPQSQVFNPSSHSNTEPWRLQTDVARVQQVQAEHAERILRLERRLEDEARMKSVWGSTSPFPSVLSGTPQQAPLQQPSTEQYRPFDDDTNPLMSSLHLDADDEPRRALGATSRANSVRFDETANQNHFSHSSRPSMDVFSRTSSSGYGGLQMTERTYSHKSEGRASSVHSIRSAASGRANSLNLDSTFGLGEANRSPLDMPTLAPGLMLLGAAPAIIRCWMNTNFKHDALLYAAVCTGSYHSFLSFRLIQKLGFDGVVRSHETGPRTVELPIFFPEAIPHPGSSRSSSPTPQLPSLSVKFRILEDMNIADDVKGIQIFLGSDMLRTHNADILFSSNSMTIFDDDDHKLSIPLSRPENQAVFQTLFTTSETLHGTLFHHRTEPPNTKTCADSSPSTAATTPPLSLHRTLTPSTDLPGPSLSAPASDSRPVSRQSTASRPSLGALNTTRPDQPPLLDTSTTATPQPSSTAPFPASSISARPSPGPTAWSSWRRDSSGGGTATSTTATPASASASFAGMDWASASKSREIPYQRKDTGIRVLKPKVSNAGNRVLSTSSVVSAGSNAGATSVGSMAGSVAMAEGKSRFFDEGRRRSGGIDGGEVRKENVGSISGTTTPGVSGSTGGSGSKVKGNPIGGGSAFSWLNSGGK